MSKNRITFDEINIKGTIQRKKGMEEINAIEMFSKVFNISNMGKVLNTSGYNICEGEIEDVDEKYFYVSLTYSQKGGEDERT